MDYAWGGHELLHLQTTKVVKRRNLTKIPITPSKIKQVHTLSTLGNIPQGLKITNRENNVIFYSAWIAGVEYYDRNLDDDKYEEENDSENNKYNDADDYK